jgi:putative tryptophan/tyrosine transport system substrate-binding protein
MRRREFITLLGAAAASPVTARAQQAEMPVIGWLGSASPAPYAGRVAAFRRGLNEIGYVDGRTVAIEFRWAEGHYDRLPALAAELIGRRVSAIVTSGGTVAASAAKAATSTIPIVFAAGGDPVKTGLVASLNRPGGNVTGVFFFGAVLRTKRLELLHEMVPRSVAIGLLMNPNNLNGEVEATDLREAARALGRQFAVLSARSEGEIDGAFAEIAQQRLGALLVGTDPFFNSRRDQITATAARHAIPAMYPLREFVASGGLMSYGTNNADEYRHAGIYVGKILKGAKPADLPVVQPTKFELVINAKTANALGLTVPDKLLALADEVIE